jgi:Zinc finger, C3HC4 type (RING finger)
MDVCEQKIFMEDECCICLEKLGKVNTMIFKCGHMCAHVSCFIPLGLSECPICRESINFPPPFHFDPVPHFDDFNIIAPLQNTNFGPLAIPFSPPKIKARLNIYKHYVIENYGFVIEGKEIKGKEDERGNIIPLSPEDIKICKKKKWVYRE